MNLIEAAEGAFTAQLPSFHGPLDLLLYLIKQNEVTIEDLPIVTITEQYLSTVDTLRAFDPEGASEFLVLAATLIEIKSKLLLPREEVDFGDIEDPRSDLIRQLLAYREFKDKARDLGQYREQRRRRFLRGRAWQDTGTPEDIPLDIADVEIWDLLTLLQKVLAETDTTEIPTFLAYDDVPIEEHMKRVIGEICQTPGRSASFRSLVQALAQDRIQLVGLFIALLELTRLKRIRLEQPRDFSDIHILGADDLNPDETPTIEDLRETSFSEQAPSEENDDTDIFFAIDKVSSEDHALDIEGFYRTNYRTDAEVALETGNETQNELETDEAASRSLDVDEDSLAVIKRAIPEPVFNPDADDLATWRRQLNPS